jgi:XamI restriction endonuclease
MAKAAFRNERLGEPLDLYNKFFAQFTAIFTNLVDELGNVAKDPVDFDLIADLVTGRAKQKAFRYLTAPPISADDLQTVADAILTPSRLRLETAQAKRVRDTILTIIDPHRFPWVMDARRPTPHEKHAAIVASAALAAASEVGTHRRNTSKAAQEHAVKALLSGIGFRQVAVREIPMLTTAPRPGQFCGETRLAGTRADVVARLKDGRVMAIECKVSNSAVNSYKRLVHDTGGKAGTWYAQLGRAQVVPAAVMSGVYSPANLLDVQNNMHVALFWQHRLKDLADFVKKAV